ncbi:putative 2,5-diketo-D-gluconic acid reductase A [Corynebacterium sp. CMW7794]|uniref:Aldo/keto reductase n=1 Tax=Corynebacterium phoceense TaxID=1686286 RepID=A0A540R4B0_9CORY|nr:MULTISPECIES: aldo/keto reductase [Corynebacterium]KXB55203.1 putative 2,5-diketo-D-gluconic acid reductase A [Corynebacterium sp. DNF00584]KXI18990.1 putative 2,5-diketo-D-gluconic acid reductase A [Corynebacterium sp. CMW7794]MBF9012151.1 aldo/keto reductase [Corynebacterium phoceense]OFL76559.1 aldo/keto reductase [Corynebacterium sp. HMSC077B05]OFN41412.1 aldo/keto reductase [Corynebacterium sp. HMSC072G08]
MGDMTVENVSFNDDREMPQLGLGTYKLRDDECVRTIREAIEIGYRKFDTATLYKNEEAVGKALKQAMDAGDVTRDEIFVTTKVWHDHHGADLAPQAFHESLDKLGLDYIDLYLIHWPWPQGGKYVETFNAIARLQGMGQIASIGVANFYEETLDTLIKESGIVPVLNQVELHPGFTQPELRAYHDEHGIITEAWSPLARGVVLTNPDIKAIAAKYEVTTGQVVLAYLLQLGISVIPKSARKERLAENFAAAELTLTRAEMDVMNSLDGREGFGRMFNDPRDFPGAEG